MMNIDAPGQNGPASDFAVLQVAVCPGFSWPWLRLVCVRSETMWVGGRGVARRTARRTAHRQEAIHGAQQQQAQQAQQAQQSSAAKEKEAANARAEKDLAVKMKELEVKEKVPHTIHLSCACTHATRHKQRRKECSAHSHPHDLRTSSCAQRRRARPPHHRHQARWSCRRKCHTRGCATCRSFTPCVAPRSVNVPLRLLTSVGQCREAGLESVSYVWQVDRLDSIMTAVEEELKKRGAPLEERA